MGRGWKGLDNPKDHQKVEDRKGEIALLILHFSAILYWRPERAQV
jgi:hypothetical protein